MKKTHSLAGAAFTLRLRCFGVSLLSTLVVISAASSTSGQQTATPPSTQLPDASVSPLLRDEAVRLALAQASTFRQAQLAELIAAEDVRQARIAFLPRVTMPFSITYNSSTRGLTSSGTPSFINANAVTEYEALASVAGEIDVSGRLRASMQRSRALLEAARAGTEVARRALIQAVDEAYYGLAFATARRRSAELNLAAAQEFERITDMLLNAGEVAEVDVVRASLQTITRRDEVEQARTAEVVAAYGLRVLIGYDLTTPLATADLMIIAPDKSEIDRFMATAISQRPELAQLDAELRAAEQEARAAHAERLPQFSYSISGGFDTDVLRAAPLREHTGVLATVSVTIPVLDWGASRSREEQARLRSQTAESERIVALRSFTQQFSAAQAQALSAANRVQLLRSGVAGAERNVEASMARYRAGEASIIEVTDAQSTLVTVRTTLYQALFDYQMARAHLAQATGQ